MKGATIMFNSIIEEGEMKMKVIYLTTSHNSTIVLGLSRARQQRTKER